MREAERAETILELVEDRFRAHQLVFKDRHPDKSPLAHQKIIEAIYDPRPRFLIEGFRGIGKSTYLEEAAVFRACLGEFRSMVIVGSSYTRACDRLTSIKRQFVGNRDLIDVFGRLRGTAWREGRIVLNNVI